jgi:hypothetical protein
VRKRIAELLSISLLALTGSVSGFAQEVQPATQEKPSAAAQEKQVAAEALAREKQAAARAVAREKRALAHEKRVAAEQQRSIANALRQATRPEGTFKLLGSRLGIGRVVKGAPYSATAITEHTQTLSDGNQIIQKNEATYYRDSEGRTRIDQKLKTIGKWTASGEAPRIITISDPVAGNYYSLDPRTRTALMDARVPQKGPRIPKGIDGPKGLNSPKELIGPKGLNGPKELNGLKSLNGPKELNGPKGIDGPKGLNGPRELHGPKGPNGPKVLDGPQREKKKQSLGTRVIEGVSAEGTRQTITIPAGEIGNVSPIEIIDESWYSPELQVPVMTSHHDPRSGDTIYRLTGINRSEPARSLFEVPADYRIVDKRAPKSPAKPEQPKIAKPAQQPEDKLLRN